MSFKPVAPRSILVLAYLLLLPLGAGGCEWNGDIYLDAGTEEDSPETQSTEVEKSDTATDTDSISGDSSEPVPTEDSGTYLSTDSSDSGNDTGSLNGDSENDTDNFPYSAWQLAGLNVEILWPPDYAYWNFVPEELCVYFIPASPDAYKPPGFKQVEEISRMTPASCVSLNWEDLKPHYFVILPMGALSDVGDDLPFVAAILFRDGNHRTDSPEEDEDYFGYTNIARPAGSIYDTSFTRISLFSLDDGH